MNFYYVVTVFTVFFQLTPAYTMDFFQIWNQRTDRKIIIINREEEDD